MEVPGLEARESEVHGSEMGSMDSPSLESMASVMTGIKLCCDVAHVAFHPFTHGNFNVDVDASVFCCMKCLLLLVSLMGTSALAQNFQTIDRVDGWLIERRVDREQNHICRASLPGGGSWFSARVRLDLNDALVVPKGLTTRNTASVDSARKALHLCRSSLLYF